MTCTIHNLIFSVCLLTLLVSAASATYSDLFQPYWSPDHIVSRDGEPLKLALDNTSGCGFSSKKKYLFGQVSMDIKLVEGDSAGTVTAYYVSGEDISSNLATDVKFVASCDRKEMSSEGPNHDELDFEFLGNVSGEPYLVQTNIYINGTGNREQRHSLWFDPTTSFHTYSFLWNRYHVRFLVDGVPIRVFADNEKSGIPYPKGRAMGVYASVWNADDWATQGGRVKTNWSNAPFVSAFDAFTIDACALEAEEDAVGKCGEGGGFWWDVPGMVALSPHQRRQLKWVRGRHLVYDYCKDGARFGNMMPAEC